MGAVGLPNWRDWIGGLRRQGGFNPAPTRLKSINQRREGVGR